jgi:hypothetical protein
MLLAKENNAERWDREVEQMEAHTKERQLRTTWAVDQVNVVDYLIDYCKLGHRFQKDLVQRVCGILEVRKNTCYFNGFPRSGESSQFEIEFIENIDRSLVYYTNQILSYIMSIHHTYTPFHALSPQG